MQGSGCITEESLLVDLGGSSGEEGISKEEAGGPEGVWEMAACAGGSGAGRARHCLGLQ